MHFTEEETSLLKTWVIKKLEDISDADADVLADYALALISTEDSEEVARANCIENLKDFLPDNAEHFVTELFAAIATKSYDPNRPIVKPASPQPQFPASRRKDALGHMHESRKRPYQWDGDETFGQNGGLSGRNNRAVKQMRRGTRGGLERGGRQPAGATAPFATQQFTQPHQMSSGQPSAPSLAPLDLNDPMVMMLMQEFMHTLVGLPDSSSPQKGMPAKPPVFGQRCGKYDEYGLCAAGHSCPFEHSNARFVPATQSQEYDPSNAMINDPPFTNFLPRNFPHCDQGDLRGRVRGSGGFRGGVKRSDFSKLGPDRDSTNTSIVVEQIPEDKVEESSIAAFFSAFGAIEEITMHPDRKLAIVKFESKAGAKAAYESPKVVFDNRFVKVYWYKPGRFEQQHIPAPKAISFTALGADMETTEQEVDRSEIASRQEEAQRMHEIAQKQRHEMEKQKASIDEKLKVMEAERKKMADLLAKKSGTPIPCAGSPAQNGDSAESEQTRALREQLAKLEAEAKELGIDPDSPFTNGYEGFTSTPYRPRGGYRGRRRGRGYYQPYRASWAGASGRGGSVRRLDNRPKTLAVHFANEKPYDANDEALRQFLLFNSMDAATVSQHPEQSDTALVLFDQRYQGENFLRIAGAQIPHAGKVVVSWYTGTPPVGVERPTNGTHENGFTEIRFERGDSEVEDREMYNTGEREREEQDLDRFA